MSTNTGRASIDATLEAEAKKAKQGTITSSPGPMLQLRSNMMSASVPLFYAIAKRAPAYSLTAFELTMLEYLVTPELKRGPKCIEGRRTIRKRELAGTRVALKFITPRTPRTS
jgi:hypothetical protein